VNDPDRVRSFERREELESEVNRVIGREISGAAEAGGERLAVEAFHDEVGAAVSEVTSVGKTTNIRVMNCSAGAGFARESRIRLGIASGAFDHLEGNESTEARVVRLVHHGTTAATELATKDIAIGQDRRAVSTHVSKVTAHAFEFCNAHTWSWITLGVDVG
jgi:hypothetical protein